MTHFVLADASEPEIKVRRVDCLIIETDRSSWATMANSDGTGPSNAKATYPI